MKLLSRIWSPAAVVSAAVAGAVGLGDPGVEYRHIPDPGYATDTVVYVRDAYKLKRVGDFEQATIADSLLMSDVEDSTETVLDTLPKITARLPEAHIRLA